MQMSGHFLQILAGMKFSFNFRNVCRLLVWPQGRFFKGVKMVYLLPEQVGNEPL